jgi:thiamine-monophosphate kinase
VLALPPDWTDDLARLADGIGEAARIGGCPIIGGDLTRSALLHCTFTVIGAASRPVPRSGARAGDLLFVTGLLGGPAAALRALNQGTILNAAYRERLARPTARVREGIWAAAHGATAMIDISDGLVSDAEHMAAASHVHLTIDLESLPVMRGCDPVEAARSGEEYELLFAAPPNLDKAAFTREFKLPVTAIGEVSQGRDSEVGTVKFRRGGQRVDLQKGYDHFSR